MIIPEFYIIFSWIIQPEYLLYSLPFICKLQHFEQNSTLLKPLVLTKLVEIKILYADHFSKKKYQSALFPKNMPIKNKT